MTAPVDNRGAVALRQCGASYDQVAARIGAKPSLVHNWTRGHRKPGPAWRATLQKVFAIRESWWDEPPPTAAPPTAPPTGLLAKVVESPAPVAQVEAPRQASSVLADPGGGTVEPRTEAEALIAHIRQYRAQVETDPVLTLTEKAKILEIASRSVERLYRQTGEAANIPASRLLAAPAMRTVLDAVKAAIVPWPEAVAAVASALENLGAK